MVGWEAMVETVKNTWPFVLIIGTHVVRTEASRAVTKTRLNNGEKNFDRVEKHFDKLENQLSDLAAENRRNNEIISADIKRLLERPHTKGP